MSTQLKLFLCLPAVVVLFAFAVTRSALAAAFFPTSVIALPPNAFNASGGTNKFDVGFVDRVSQTYALADIKNNAVDLVDISTNPPTFKTYLTGCGPTPAANCKGIDGPSGVIIVNHNEVWVGDNNGNLNALNMSDNTVIQMNTGGKGRADELCEAEGHKVVMIANDDDGFVTFWSTVDHSFLGKVAFDGGVSAKGIVAGNGTEQCKFDRRTQKFYLGIPAPTSNPAVAGVVVTLPVSAPFAVLDVFPIDGSSTGCTQGPKGMAIGPKHQILLGCGKGSAGSLIIDDRDGTTLHTIPGVTSDEVWYNPGSKRYYLAQVGLKANSAATPPVAALAPELFAVDQTGFVTKALTTEIGSHSVAADSVTNRVFVPIASPSPLCGDDSLGQPLNGCIAVFADVNRR